MDTLQLLSIHDLARLLRQIAIIAFAQTRVLDDGPFRAEADLGRAIGTLEVGAEYGVEMVVLVALAHFYGLLFAERRERHIIPARRKMGFIVERRAVGFEDEGDHDFQSIQ